MKKLDRNASTHSCHGTRSGQRLSPSRTRTGLSRLLTVGIMAWSMTLGSTWTWAIVNGTRPEVWQQERLVTKPLKDLALRERKAANLQADYQGRSHSLIMATERGDSPSSEGAEAYPTTPFPLKTDMRMVMSEGAE